MLVGASIWSFTCVGATRIWCLYNNPHPKRDKIHMVKVRHIGLIRTVRLYWTGSTVSQTYIKCLLFGLLTVQLFQINKLNN